MVNYERIAAEAAELAREYWLEIEAEFTQQAAQCWAGLPTRASIPCDPACAMNQNLSHAADRSCCGECTAQPLYCFRSQHVVRE
jgi:hypothetical protein